METAQERELQARQAWPSDMMTSSDASHSRISGSSGAITDGFLLLGWDPLLGSSSFGLLGDADFHELFPPCKESPVSSEASTAVAGVPPEKGAAPMPEELDGLLQNFWGTELLQSTTSLLDADPLGSIFSRGPTSPEKFASQPPPPPEPLCSTSSDRRVDPPISDPRGVQRQTTPPMPHSSPKRPRPEGTEMECSQMSSKRRKVSSAVISPFAMVKPDGLDGGATLADINERILMRPARPVRHPVGEFACAPRVSAAGKPGPSGRTVASFTRLRTPRRGTITIIRTKG